METSIKKIMTLLLIILFVMPCLGLAALEKRSKPLYDYGNLIQELPKSKVGKPANNTLSTIQVPPEPQYSIPEQTIPSIPDALSNSIAKIEKSSNSQAVSTWKDILHKEPTFKNLQLFLKTLDSQQLLELMDYTSESDPNFASGLIEVAIIPELKSKWSQKISPWQNQVPYGQLLKIASDKKKPKLMRKVMIDMLGNCKRITNKNRKIISKQIAHGLLKIIEDTENHGSIRAYAVTDLGLILQEQDDDVSTYSEIFLRLSQDSSEEVSVRVKSLQMLPFLNNTQAISVIEKNCMDYQPEDNAAIAKANIVALSDYSQKNKIDTMEKILHVLIVTKDPETFSACLYAASRMDESSLMAALPVIMAEKERFKDNHLVEDSINAALWRRPYAVMNAIDSNDEEMVQAGIKAACYIPLPPKKERLKELLEASPGNLQGIIRKALKRAEDIEGYESILNQIEKEGR